jgi:hypothetical protein
MKTENQKYILSITFMGINGSLKSDTYNPMTLKEVTKKILSFSDVVEIYTIEKQ